MIIRAPFDAHCHLRQGGMLRAVAPLAARSFPGGLLAMPNTDPPITHPTQAMNYRRYVEQVVGTTTRLVVTGYLTEDTDPRSVEDGWAAGAWRAMKFYPHGLTTNSHGGVSDVRKLARVLETMERIGMPLLVHGERATTHGMTGKMPEASLDVYDREAAFYKDDAKWIVGKFPDLKVSFEHGSSCAFCDFISAYGHEDVVGTITPHHLLMDRNDFFADGPDVHLHCWPVLKRREDREALVQLATTSPWVHAGTDSAPHSTRDKERACGCAGGVFYAEGQAVALYAEVFAVAGALDRLEAFLSVRGPNFFGLACNDSTVELVEESWTVDRMIHNVGVTVSDGRGGAYQTRFSVRPLFYHEDPARRRQMKWRMKV